MKILLFIAVGFIAGYIVKDLLTKESEIIYHIKRLRAKKGGSIDVNSEIIIDNKKEKKNRGRKSRKNK